MGGVGNFLIYIGRLNAPVTFKKKCLRYAKEKKLNACACHEKKRFSNK